nr:dihydroneopterin aldolase [uncultured Prevotella sp.]
MAVKSSYILLENVKFYAFHGVLPQERKVGNDYQVSLRIGYDISRAMVSDDVNDTLNYAEVYQLLRQEMSVPSALLERVAGRIGDRLFRKFPAIQSIDLTIIKVNPPMGADSEGAGVEVHLINDKTL